MHDGCYNNAANSVLVNLDTSAWYLFGGTENFSAQ